MNEESDISPFEAARILAWRIDIIDQLIREDPDNTIADYLELVAHLEQIENTSKYRNEIRNHQP